MLAISSMPRSADVLPTITVISPPVEGGVADFSRIIAEAVGGRYLHYDPAAPEFSAAGLSRASDGRRPVFLIQFSGYGYQKRGVPLAFLDWVRRLKRSGAMVGVYFHELYATGPPWASSFWLSPAQRYIAAELARVSDFWITSWQGSADWLNGIADAKPHAVLPVFSNVGEASGFLQPREPALIVFGSAALRRKAYDLTGDLLFEWAASQRLRLVDIGPGLEAAGEAARLTAKGVQILGRLDPEVVGRKLATAKYGLVAYTIHKAAKSGVLAAYCAHGVAPIVVSTSYEPSDGLNANVQYLKWPPEAGLPHSTSDSIGQNALTWYRSHSIEAHREAIVALAAKATQSARDAGTGEPARRNQ